MIGTAVAVILAASATLVAAEQTLVAEAPASVPTDVSLPAKLGEAAAMSEPQLRLLAVARETNLPAARRRQAVRSLLDQGDEAVIAELVGALARGGDPSLQRVLAQALATGDEAPPEAFAMPLLDLLLQADDALTADLAAALGRYRSTHLSTQVTRLLLAAARDDQAPVAQRCAAIRPLAFQSSKLVVAMLVELLGSEPPPIIARHAAEALELISGLDSLGLAAAPWQQWWEKHKDLPPARWYALLAVNRARRAARLERENQVIGQKLLEACRKLYRATAQQGREDLLVDLLADAAASLRQLAIELMRQRLSDRQPFGPALRGALLPALNDSEASIRQDVAWLLRDLGDEPGADAMARRLIAGQERDPAVLRVYLLVMADQPRARVIKPATALLDDPLLGNEAAGVLVRAAKEDFLGEAQKAALKLRLRRRIDAATPPAPKVIELLGYVGDEDDWGRIRQWIDSAQDEVKEAAALAWARSDNPLDVLARRAGDLRIQPIVIAAATRRGQLTSTLLALLEHPPGQEQMRQAWQRALIAMAGRIPAAGMLEADTALLNAAPVDAQQTPDLRQQMLSAAIAAALPDNGNNNGNGDPPPPPNADPNVLVDLLLRRAEIRLADAKPKAALADLKLITMRQWDLPAAESNRHDALNMRASLATGDRQTAFQVAGKVFDRAAGEGDDALARAAAAVAPLFLDAADRHVKANQPEPARAILVSLEARVGRFLSPALKDRLQQLRVRVGPEVPANGGPPTAAPPPAQKPNSQAAPAAG